MFPCTKKFRSFANGIGTRELEKLLKGKMSENVSLVRGTTKCPRFMGESGIVITKKVT